MKTSPAGLQFIEDNEGSSLIEYKDIAGKWSIGVGHLIVPPESYPDGITEEECLALLAGDVAHVENALNALIPEDCTQNQFDACTDFGFNLGVGALRTMLGHGWGQVPVQMPRWDMADGQTIPGLAARRRREVDLFSMS